MKRKNFLKVSGGSLLLSILLVSLVAMPSILAAGAYTWTNETAATSLHGLPWVSIATSSTGQKLAAVASGGDIYTSSDYGVSWTDITPSGTLHNKNWTTITSNASGQYLTAVINFGNVYASSDYGATWTAGSGPISGHGWQPQALALSSTGQYQAAATDGGIYTSSDYGATWVSDSSSGPTAGLSFSSVAGSADGKNLVAVADSVRGGHIFTSTNFGTTWTDRGNNSYWQSVASSSTGQYLTAGSNGGQLYKSMDYGVNWVDVTPAGSSQGWQTITSSSTGQYQAAGGSYNGDIYITSDYGATWTNETATGALHNRYWNSLAMNSTGQRIAAVEVGADIYNGNNPVLSPPKPGIVNRTTTVAVNGNVVVDVLGGVSGNPDSSTLAIISGPSHGTAVRQLGSISYTPNAGYAGTDSLTYQVCSSLDNTVCSQAVLNFNVGIATAIKAPNTGYGTYHQSNIPAIMMTVSALATAIGLSLRRRPR